MALSTCQPDWIQQVKLGYEEDPEALKLLKLWEEEGQLPQEYSVNEGLIKHRGRVWLGSNSLAHQHIIQAFHDSGVEVTQGFWHHTIE